MKVANRYNIAYKGLSIGEHHFSFEVDDALFKAYENSEILGGKATVEIDLVKGGTVMNLNVVIKGEVSVECDRCLEPVTLPIDYDGDLVVRFSEHEQESDGDIMWVNPAEGELHLAQYIYESIVLNLPYQRVHPNIKDCNPEMVKNFKIEE